MSLKAVKVLYSEAERLYLHHLRWEEGVAISVSSLDESRYTVWVFRRLADEEGLGADH